MALGCIMTAATWGCGDSRDARFGHRDADDDLALDAGDRKDGSSVSDAVQDRRPEALGEAGLPLDAESPVQTDRDALGDAWSEQADQQADAHEEADVAVSPEDAPTTAIEPAPQPDAPAVSDDATEVPLDSGTSDTYAREEVDAPVGPADAGGGRLDQDAGPLLVDASAMTDQDGSPDGDAGMDAVSSAYPDAWIEIDVAAPADAPVADAANEGDGSASYRIQSEYLLDPDLAKGMLKSLADFRVRAIDPVSGGSFTYTKVDGTVGTDHRKSFVSQTRDAWAFSRAFMITGDESYLDHAAHELDFLTAHAWDSDNGGWYFIGDEQGNVTGDSRNTYKGCFIQHYALLGIGALCDATRDQSTCAWLQKGRTFLDDKMWDAHPERLGYYDYGSLDLTTVRSKSFTSTVDAMTTHAIQSALLWPGNQAYQQRVLDLADIVADRLAANIDLPTAKFGFPEVYNTDWTVDTSQIVGWVGHVLKSAWVLARAYQLHPEPRYRQAARKLIFEVLNNGGWDEAHGVPYTTTNWSTGAQDTTQTECWQIQQAIMSGLSNWYIADGQEDKDTYLRMADRALVFFVEHVVDHVQGGTWKMNQISGAPKGNSKSNEYNVEYHSTETFYFTYLYGNLMLHGRPVTLYYRVSPSTLQQTIQLNPVAIDNASLRIQSVTLNGTPFSGFSPLTREVTLAANQGGKLAVTFGRGP
jgi:mannose/cellobiose epimerase-like protein (N-acyl-D-glucosamine 2-epimerase family)